MKTGRKLRSTRFTLLALLLAALALVAVGCGSDDEDTVASGGETTVTETESEPTETAEAPEPAPKPGGEAPKAETVDMLDFEFDAVDVTIQTGGKINWINEGETAHNAVADDGSFDTGTVDPGKRASEAEAFKTAGSFPYVCTFHPGMEGTIEVVEP